LNPYVSLRMPQCNIFLAHCNPRTNPTDSTRESTATQFSDSQTSFTKCFCYRHTKVTLFCTAPKFRSEVRSTRANQSQRLGLLAQLTEADLNCAFRGKSGATHRVGHHRTFGHRATAACGQLGKGTKLCQLWRCVRLFWGLFCHVYPSLCDYSDSSLVEIQLKR